MSSRIFFASVLLSFLGALSAQSPQETQQRDLKYKKDEPPQQAAAIAGVDIPRGYALVIGVAKYQNLSPSQNLRFSERDAQSVYDILLNPEGGNFPAENIRRLVGPDATLANIRKGMDWLVKVAQPSDRVLIYFAGHGFVSDGKPYLAPYDLSPDNIPGTGYPMETLSAVAGRIKAKWKVLLTDACHSGAIAPSDTQTFNGRLLDLDRSLFSLAASRDREQSFESPAWGDGHGIFTYYVVRGLEGEADVNQDGIVTADELSEYVRREVREATKNAMGGPQTPVDRGSFDRDMLLAYIPSRTKLDAKLPPPKSGTLVFVSNMDGVEIFLDDRSIGVLKKGAPFRQPGLAPGAHTIKAVRMGFEPDGPREEYVYPGQETTIQLNILIPVRRPRAAVEEFDKGVSDYLKGNPDNYHRAVAHFDKALQIEPTYSEAACYLGRTWNALSKEEESKKYYLLAIRLAPDYLDAHTSFAGTLLDMGDLDEAVRQLTYVTEHASQQAFAYYLLSQAFVRKEDYTQGTAAARRAIALTPQNAEAHFWLAESLRMSRKYREAVSEYDEYLRLSDFDTKLAGKLNYYVLGYLIGHGKKTAPSQRDIWRDLRSQAYFGLCDCQQNVAQYDSAIDSCQRALSYDRQDALTHYVLALCFASKANDSGKAGYAVAARDHFSDMLRINPDLPESAYARQNIANIDAALAQAR